MTWHVDAPMWEAYAAGQLDAAAEASVETHVTGCAPCRGAARAKVAPETAQQTWTSVRTTISAPPLSFPLRMLRRAGVPEQDLVVIDAADSLRLPWAVAVGSAVACACLIGLAGFTAANRDAAFLALGPLIPVLAVIAAFDALDALREVAAATPYSKFRLAMLRAGAALTVAVPMTLAVGLLVPGLQDLAFVWLAPSLGLTVGVLVLLTWYDVWVAGALTVASWVLLVLGLHTTGDVDVLTSVVAQVTCTAVAVVLAVMLGLRTSTLHLQGGEL